MLDNLKKKKLLAQLNSNANTNGALDPKEKDASTVTRGMFNAEILAGKSMKKDFQGKIGATDDEMNEADFKAKTTIGYVKPKGQVSTDEPPVDLAPDENEMMDNPTYKALLENLYKKKKGK